MNEATTFKNKPVIQLTKFRRLWIAILLGSLSAFGPLSIDMYLPSLPKLTADLGTSESLTQFTLTAFLLGLALGQLVVGPLSDIKGRRSPLIISLILYAVSSLLCAFAPTIETLVALRFIQGLSGAAGIVLSKAVVRDLYSGTELTKFFSLLMLINGAAPILAPLIGGQLLRIFPWRGVFVVLFAVGVLMLLLVILGLPETLPKHLRVAGGWKQTMTTFGRLIRNRVFMGYTLAQGLISAAMFAYISGSSFVMQNVYGVTPQVYSLIFAVNGIGIIFASQLTGRLAGRVREKTLFVTGLIIAGVGSTVLLIDIIFTSHILGVLIPLFFVIASVGMVGTSGFPLAMRDQQDAAGSASALLGLLPFILGAACAPLVGIGGGGSALPMGIVMITANLLGILGYYLLVHRARH
ncbi:DHA1 family bicyclomycin/chloramphenicol resistance-like MFS transporter [Paenibacillus shirakamiensis]|uniref:Bcr/CflA family efflux transporter n=1 Tax=Paenibacillus shirakamiensis TaxID=1265935 RepID=A0ABS4JGT4_9BACL|nr:multidrug effflux MFS transporter [Paenibacillus shirakamiensis]MBP2000929.1 DHA1 family bicyclomycin/chloramphenicol resistance-like MFS transporter [Paenibacillus shirakamiensis]